MKNGDVDSITIYYQDISLLSSLPSCQDNNHIYHKSSCLFSDLDNSHMPSIWKQTLQMELSYHVRYISTMLLKTGISFSLYQCCKIFKITYTDGEDRFSSLTQDIKLIDWIFICV